LLFVALLALAVTIGRTVHAQTGGVELFQCYSDKIDLTYWHEQQGSLKPGFELFYTYNFSLPGPLNITLTPHATSTQPIEIVVIDARSGQYLYRSSPSTSLTFTATLNLTSPTSVEIGIYNPGQISADYGGVIYISFCGTPAVAKWIEDNIKLNPSSMGNAAPIGIADYGAMLLAGEATFYRISTDSVRGIVNISSDIYATSYYENGTMAFSGFTVQLNAFLSVNLADGNKQFYWLQNVLDWKSSYGSLLGYIDNVWNETSSVSTFSSGNIAGRGGIFFSGRGAGEQYYAYGMGGTLQPGSHQLTIAVHGYGGGLRVDFYVDSNLYDTVIITPYTRITSASIVVDPSIRTGYRISPDLELVFAGFSSSEPIAVLSKGTVQLSLFYNSSGKWLPPFAAWSIGASTFERAIASAVGGSSGTVSIFPGNPSKYELWSGAVVVVTPYGTFFQNDGNITQYLKEIDFGNGTKLANPVAYINGVRVQENTVPLGSVVVVEYTREYHVTMNSTLGKFEIWVPEQTPLKGLLNETIIISPNVRLVLEETYANGVEVNYNSYLIDGPTNVTLIYSREFLISLYSNLGREELWVKEGENLASVVPTIKSLGNGTAFVIVSLCFDGKQVDPSSFSISSPGNLNASYSLAYQVKLIGPTNSTELWILSGSQLDLHPQAIILLGNNTRLVFMGAEDSSGRNITFPLKITSPAAIELIYGREYLVSIELYKGNFSEWVPEGNILNLSQAELLKEGKSYIYGYSITLLLRYIVTPSGIILPNSTVNGPIDGKAIYSAFADIKTEFLGIPNFFSFSVLSCGSQSNQSISFLSSEQTLTIEDPRSFQCSVDVPISLPLPLAAALVMVFLGIAFARRKMKQ
jgi:hypothetical protein